mmetsp:Transcript_81601/g.189519  ORF Transcript_81601/g.189519 Transcript_81601/m.189519 type:complete len:121 (-) Transcript_81601:226-588(-)
MNGGGATDAAPVGGAAAADEASAATASSCGRASTVSTITLGGAPETAGGAGAPGNRTLGGPGDPVEASGRRDGVKVEAVEAMVQGAVRVGDNIRRVPTRSAETNPEFGGDRPLGECMPWP